MAITLDRDAFTEQFARACGVYHCLLSPLLLEMTLFSVADEFHHA